MIPNTWHRGIRRRAASPEFLKHIPKLRLPHRARGSIRIQERPALALGRMSDIDALQPENGLGAVGVRKSWMNEPAVSRHCYGEFDFWPMRGTVRPSSRRAWRVASLRYWGTVRGFLVLEWWWNGSIGSQLTTSDTRGAIGRSAVAAARVWSSPCRVTKEASRLGLADAGAPWADSSGRRSR